MSVSVSYAENVGVGASIGVLGGGAVFSTFANVPLSSTHLPHFKMAGFNQSTQQWEIWFSVGKPDPRPPSKARLTGVRHVRIG